MGRYLSQILLTLWVNMSFFIHHCDRWKFRLRKPSEPLRRFKRSAASFFGVDLGSQAPRWDSGTDEADLGTLPLVRAALNRAGAGGGCLEAH
jgi:hypothetical protein